MVGYNISGITVVDKPEGWTSRQAVDYVQDVLRVKKAGHAGTLDPLSTGVLVICLNEATKLVQFLVDDSKDYLVTMLLGVRTDTLDREGKILSEQEPRVGLTEIREVLPGFLGKATQAAPYYSAVKHQGKPLYKWARQGIHVEKQPRPVEIYRIELIEVELPYVTFFVSCSKGTYIRSLCAAFGDRLGSGACLWSLRRMRSGIFSAADAVSLTETKEIDLRESLIRQVISITDALPALKTVYIDQEFADKLKGGHQPRAGSFRAPHIPLFTTGDMVKFVHENGNRLVAVARALFGAPDIPLLDDDRQTAKILRVFNE